jgi:hypothetical protein
MVSARAGLHRHQASRLAGEERQHLLTSQLLAENHAPRRIRAVRLEDVLGQIQADRRNLAHRTPPS